MYRASILLFPLLVSPIAAHASSIASIGAVSCSGNQTTSLTETVSFQCSGDFSLSGGSITSDLKIAISADGSLLLENLSINAPVIELSVLKGALSIADSVSINGNAVLGTESPSISIAERINWQTYEIDNSINVSFNQPGDKISLSNRTQFGSSIEAGRGVLLTPRDYPFGGSVILNNGGRELIFPAGAGVIGISVFIPPNGGAITSIATVPAPSSYLSMVFGLLTLIGLRFGRMEGACEPIHGRLFF